jgi:hypothetical protein
MLSNPGTVSFVPGNHDPFTSYSVKLSPHMEGYEGPYYGASTRWYLGVLQDSFVQGVFRVLLASCNMAEITYRNTGCASGATSREGSRTVVNHVLRTGPWKIVR